MHTPKPVETPQLTAASPSLRVRPALSRTVLSEIVELALWVGRLQMESGAGTQHVEESVRIVGVGLGCDWGHIVVTHGAIIATYFGGGDFRTKLLSVRCGGVNMTALEALSHLCHRIEEHRVGVADVRAELERIEGTGRVYSELQTWLSGGVGCAAFCGLFEGDAPAPALAMTASSVAMAVRSACSRRRYNPLVTAGVVALVAGIIVGGLQALTSISRTPAAALAASVLMLVPGTAVMNAVEDLIKGSRVDLLGTGHLRRLDLDLRRARAVVRDAADGGEAVMSVLITAFWGGLSAAGFAVILNVPKRALLACALAGVLGHVTRTHSIPLTSPAVGSFLAAFAVSLFGIGCGRRLRAPAVVFVIPGIIPLIPGSLAFRAIIDTLSVINTTGTAQHTALLAAALSAVRSTLVTAALASGIAVPSLLLRREPPLKSG